MIYHNYSAIKNMIKFEMSRIKLDEWLVFSYKLLKLKKHYLILC